MHEIYLKKTNWLKCTHAICLLQGEIIFESKTVNVIVVGIGQK